MPTGIRCGHAGCPNVPETIGDQMLAQHGLGQWHCVEHDQTIKQMMRFNRERAFRLEDAYNLAVAGQKESFQFDGADFLTSYAKYVLEFLRMKGILNNGNAQASR